jgi:hypothetical protein
MSLKIHDFNPEARNLIIWLRYLILHVEDRARVYEKNGITGYNKIHDALITVEINLVNDKDINPSKITGTINMLKEIRATMKDISGEHYEIFIISTIIDFLVEFEKYPTSMRVE